jgi:hypothetical protein
MVGVAQTDLVAQRVGQRLARVAAHDSVPAQVQRGVQLDELHRPPSRQLGEHHVSEGPSSHPRRIGVDRWERGSIVSGRAAAVAVRHPWVQAVAKAGELGQQVDPPGGEGGGVLVEAIEVAEHCNALGLQLEATAPGHPTGDAHHRHVEVVVAAAPRANGHGRAPGGDRQWKGGASLPR